MIAGLRLGAALVLASQFFVFGSAYLLPQQRRLLSRPEKSIALREGRDGANDFEATSLELIRQARRMLASDNGILDESLLADDFLWVGPYVDQPLNKREYLAAGRFFDLRSAFPDLDFRAHDFRLDESDPYTIRISCRVTGTMRGALRLRTGTLPPTGKKLKEPPTTTSITFNRSGKATKLLTGFCMDPQVGNTKGATGVMAAALVAGQAPSDWDLYPAPTVVKRFFGRPITALTESKTVLAPFPDNVMVQLAKGILATNMASDDPSLLAENFEYLTPYRGPVRKKTYIEKYAREEFDGVDPSFSHFRVDPYDPVRVWVDVLPNGPGYQGSPQSMSFSFDEDGFCKRITSAFVLDPTVGNAGGLGGVEGVRYATGKGSFDLLTRPLARVIGRARKKVLSPLTGVDVDDFVTIEQAKARASQQRSKAELDGISVPTKVVESGPSEKLSGLKAASSTSIPMPKVPETVVKVPAPPTVEATKQDQKNSMGVVDSRVKGTDEAKRLLAEVQAAEKIAKQARAKLAKLEEERLQTEKKIRAAQLERIAKEKKADDDRKASADLRRQKTADHKKAAKKKEQAASNALAQAAERAQALLADATAKRTKKAEVDRSSAESKLKQIEERRMQQAEEKRKKEEARKALVAKRKADAEAERARFAELRRKQAEEQKALAEKRRIAQKKQIEAAKSARQELVASQKASQALQKEQAAKNQKKVALQQAEKKRLQQESQKAIKQAQLQAKKDEQDDITKAAQARQLARQQEALKSLSEAVTRATISLFGIGGDNEDANVEESKQKKKQPPFAKVEKASSGAPKGVPVLKRWRKNKDGAITGLVFGSKSFRDGERVTTSPIALGKVASGEVVQTGSRSKYYLQ